MSVRLPGNNEKNHQKAATNRESAFDRKLQQFRITGEIATTTNKQKEVARKLTSDYEYHSLDSKMLTDQRLSELENLAFEDQLTGALNKRTILSKLDRQIKRAIRYKQALAMMILEVDEFEQIQAETRAFAVENLVRNVCSLLRKNIRDVDLLARVEGGRFMIVCPETSLGQICVMAERLRNLFATARLTSLGYNLSVTLSIGVSALPQSGESQSEMVSAAEEALNLAKQNGGNFTAEPINYNGGLSFTPAEPPAQVSDFSPTEEEKEELELLASMGEVDLVVPEVEATLTGASAVPQIVPRV